jgi:hypothetical protein
LDSSIFNSSTAPIEEVGPSTVQDSDSSGPSDSSTSSTQDPKSETTGDVHQAGDAHKPPTQNPESKIQNGEGPALKKAARAILHRRRAILNRARREAQHVMRLLIRAAQRSATATRETC